ncbi:MAG TPA: NADH-quinone oxidoreductase subunit H, partial [Verrucomicrobiae bacterium]|nr:NADH-quinone oxidoreductase subunit H [Verrucomicrobiae bacterium]
MGVLAWGIAQPILLVLLAPLVNGVIKKSKAFLQNRRGPGLLQGYYDLQKLFHKDRVVSEHSSWIFRVTPFVVFAAVVATTFIIPVLI